MNNIGKIALLALTALFFLLALFYFVHWFEVLSGDPNKGFGMSEVRLSREPTEIGPVLLISVLSFLGLGTLALLTYLHRRRIS